MRMEVGAITESVEVTASTPLLEPQTSSLGQVVDGRKVRDLPLNGRNPLALVALVPAVIPQSGSQGSPGRAKSLVARATSRSAAARPTRARPIWTARR